MEYYSYLDCNNGRYWLSVKPVDDESGESKEFWLASESPITVSYGESESIYSPIRTSVMTINVVYDEYLHDVLRPTALGTKVDFSYRSFGPLFTLKYWEGFLDNNMLDAPYEHCIETFSITASDYLAKSKHINYENVGETKNIVNFKQILEIFLSKVNPSENFHIYWPDTRLVNQDPIKLEDIQISEFNFYTSDTEKPFTFYEVIEELCKYFGVTAIQWMDGIYFADYEAFTRRDGMSFFNYVWDEDNGELAIDEYAVEVKDRYVITADSYRRNGGRVTFDNPKNKIKVNDNFFDADIVVPDIFDDSVLTYLYGGKNEVRPITQPMGRPKYIGADTKINFESEEKYNYYRKELDNPNYGELWYKMSGGSESAVTKAEVDGFTEFKVDNFQEFEGSSVTTKYGWRWQCYWGSSPYTTVANWELQEFGIGIDIESTGTHTEIGSYQNWQNHDNSKTFTAEFVGRYAWQGYWLAEFRLSYYSATASIQGNFTYIDDNYWHPYYENEGDMNPVFWYCVNPWNGSVGFIPFDDDWRVSTTYPIFSNEAPNYMPQIYYDVFLPVEYSGITGAGCIYTVFNYRSDKPRTYTATLWYANHSASTTFSVEAYSALTVETNLFCTVTQDSDRDSWSLEVTSEEGMTTATSWSRLYGPNPVYPQTPELIKNWIGSRIVEMANVEKQEKNPTNKLSFTRYLLLALHGSPRDKDNTITNHLPLYELKSINAPAVFVADGTYFYIQCNALFTRYWGYDYIGQEWAQDKSRIYHNDGGPTRNNTPALVFCFGIGDKYWNGTSWQSSKCNFKVQLYNSGDDGSQEEQKDLKCWNLQMPIKNQLGWAQWTTGEGYKIKFDETLDLNGKITFEICTPMQLQTAPNTSMPGGGSWASYDSSFNGYCWISDLKVGIAIKNDMKYDNADILYESVIDEDSVTEMEEISLKLTTYPKLGKLAYSNVGYKGKLIDTIKDTSLDAEDTIPEAAIVQRYYNQYSTPTRREYITLDLENSPFTIFQDDYWGCDFAVVGQTIDYIRGENSLSLEEIKKNSGAMTGVPVKYWMTPGTPEPDWWQQTYWDANVAGHSYDIATGEGVITFADVVGRVRTGAFTNNPNLIKLELPYSIDVIGNAISGNTNLTAITCHAFIAPDFTSSPKALSGNSHSNGSVLTFPDGADYSVWYERLGNYWTNRTLAFAQSGATVSFKGGSYNVAYTYDGTEKIRVSNISINGVTAEIQDGNMVYTVPANPSVTSGRTFTITITNGMGTSATFTVQQPMATYSLQQNVLEARLNAKGNIGEPLEIAYDGNVNNLTISAVTTGGTWLSVSGGTWTDGENGFKFCTLEYSAYENTTNAVREGTITVTDGVSSVSFHIEQEKAIHVSEIEVWYNIGAGWVKATAYVPSAVAPDFLLPAEAANGELIIRFTSDDNRSQNIYYVGQTEGYQTGGYASWFVNGMKIYYWDNNPLLGGKYFRFNTSILGSFNKALVTSGNISTLKERFSIYRLYHNNDGEYDAVEGVFPGGSINSYVLSFDIKSSNENQLLSKHQFKIYLAK